jgi:uncharacterized MAPEG superfamily protein
MSFPLWMLLGFAMWTVAVLVFAIGGYRFSYILTGRAGMASFPADGREGAGWYQRAMRAHANCVENLPLFSVVVFALYASGIDTPLANALAAIALAARVCQSLVHISTVQSDRVVTLRFSLFFAQLLCFAGIAAVVIMSGTPKA